MCPKTWQNSLSPLKNTSSWGNVCPHNLLTGNDAQLSETYKRVKEVPRVLSLVIRTPLQEIRTSSRDSEEGTEPGFPVAQMTVLVTGLYRHSRSLALFSPHLPTVASWTFNYLYEVEQLQQERLTHTACTCSFIHILHHNKKFKSLTLLGQRIIFWPVIYIMWQKRKENGYSICNSAFQLFHSCL